MRRAVWLLALLLLLPAVYAAYGDVECEIIKDGGDKVTYCVFDAGEFDSLRTTASIDLASEAGAKAKAYMAAVGAKDGNSRKKDAGADFSGWIAAAGDFNSAFLVSGLSTLDKDCFPLATEYGFVGTDSSGVYTPDRPKRAVTQRNYFDASKKTFNIYYLPTCQACHKALRVDLAPVSHKGYRLGISFGVNCKDVDTVILGNGLDSGYGGLAKVYGSPYPKAQYPNEYSYTPFYGIRVYAAEAAKRGESVKFIDYSSGKALKDSSSPVSPTNCVLSASASAEEVRDKCVYYLKRGGDASGKSAVFTQDSSKPRTLLLAGDPAWGGVPSGPALDFKDLLSTAAFGQLGGFSQGEPSFACEKCFDSDWESDFKNFASASKAGAQPKQPSGGYLTVSRMPGESELISKTLVNSKPDARTSLMLLADTCGGEGCVLNKLGKSVFELVKSLPFGSLDSAGDPSFVTAPRYCVMPDSDHPTPDTAALECDFNLLKSKLASYDAAWFVVHASEGLPRMVVAKDQSETKWYVVMHGSYFTDDPQKGRIIFFDKLPKTVFLQSCNTAKWGEKLGSRRDVSVARAFMRSGVYSVVGYTSFAPFVADTLCWGASGPKKDCDSVRSNAAYNKWSVIDPLAETYLYSSAKASTLGQAQASVTLDYFAQKFRSDCVAALSRGFEAQRAAIGEYCDNAFASYYPSYAWNIAGLASAGVPNYKVS
ncbi:hypothetical protein COX86_03215 [Candidatus Micrarchaeota archaeon CG_4_10_14_0_2_um_filter_60_11]|nr:MAG: hypothetical protein AUJ16_02500 [Candidatus Micrarchaeota archaeon CG1_02_60_51]PIZ90772.1 MAG: hypothetical protein COX86_03215 [Candidatus Micrarchaeota archaeon CG_4_10_14_0_2_um_filter_60_11]